MNVAQTQTRIDTVGSEFQRFPVSGSRLIKLRQLGMNTSDFLINDAALKAINRRIDIVGRLHPPNRLECLKRLPWFPATPVKFGQVEKDVSRCRKQLAPTFRKCFGFIYQLSLEQD